MIWDALFESKIRYEILQCYGSNLEWAFVFTQHIVAVIWLDGCNLIGWLVG